jgi:hypothetical protein
VTVGAEKTFGHWVRRGVVTLARELPWASARMGAALGARGVHLVEDDRDVRRLDERRQLDGDLPRQRRRFRTLHGIRGDLELRDAGSCARARGR